MNVFSAQAYLDDVTHSIRKHKVMAERAFGQLDDGAFFQKPAAECNSVAVVVKHLAGNLTARWTDFLTTDGEKPWRDRDAEFVIAPEDTRANLLAAWEKGFQALLQTLETLQEGDFTKQVMIRGEPHTVAQAIQRSLTHTVYHIGQIIYIAKMLKTADWQWITIPPGQSKQHSKPYLQ